MYLLLALISLGGVSALPDGADCSAGIECASQRCVGADSYVVLATVSAEGTRSLSESTYRQSSARCSTGVGPGSFGFGQCTSNSECSPSAVCLRGLCYALEESRCAVEFPLASIPDTARIARAQVRLRNYSGSIGLDTNFDLYLGTGEPTFDVLATTELVSSQVIRGTPQFAEVDITDAYRLLDPALGFLGARLSKPTDSVDSGSEVSGWESVNTAYAARLTVETVGTCQPYPLLQTQTAIAVGSAECPFGGTRTDSGLDDGGSTDTALDGVLGATEVDSTNTVCASDPSVPSEPQVPGQEPPVNETPDDQAPEQSGDDDGCKATHPANTSVLAVLALALRIKRRAKPL